MRVDDVAIAALKAVETVGGATVSKNAFFIGAKILLADGGLSQAWTAVEEHRWSDLVDLGITDGAKIIAAVDPTLAPIAPLAAAIIIYARHHPAGTLSAAMLRADGQGGAPSTMHVVA